jgi:hypothetical protein
MSGAVKQRVAMGRKVPPTHSTGNVMGNRRSANLQSAEEDTEGLQVNEAALRSEVGFWREMIRARSDALPAEAVERMHHALALAEHRLVALYGHRHEEKSPQVIDLAAARRRVA